MRNAIWWREECLATASGDTGRILEILKVWIFTFTGSGNPFYSTYLLETYCNFKWEFPPPLAEMIKNNWLVNLHGHPGRFIERDLMQEHHNFWLEDLAQHKGTEFNDRFYRDIISMHVHQFLRLKEQMEERVSLKARGKKHTAPHLHNELRAMMDVLRSHEVHLRRPGRNEGFRATDDFEAVLESLKKKKIREFIARTTTHIDILGYNSATTPQDSSEIHNEDHDCDEEYHFPSRAPREPPPAPLSMDHGTLYTQAAS